MKHSTLTAAIPLFSRRETAAQIALDAGDYLNRIALVRDKMKQTHLDFLVFYGDREHFANIEYLSGYDCRFEESIYILPVSGAPALLVGNEGMSYAKAIPYETRLLYYRNLSLQGQPRRTDEHLDRIFQSLGIGSQSSVGLCGYKYFEAAYCETDPVHTFDVPAYIVDLLKKVCGSLVNSTAIMTGLDGGVRLCVHSAKEIAQAEAAACRSANAVLNMLDALRPGISEYAVSVASRCGFAPVTMFPLVNFGDRDTLLGIASPHEDVALHLGEPCCVCYGARGSLTSRVSVAAYDEASMGQLKPYLFSFYGRYFEALCRWYETLRIGVEGDALHHAVHDLIGAEEYHVGLNVGHFTGQDEWTNALSFDGSRYTVPDGAYMQSDMIASNPSPVRSAICEDTVIVAGPALRESLREQYPEVFARISERRRAMMDVLGMELHDEVLPLSNLNTVMFPFMLNRNVVFALSREAD